MDNDVEDCFADRLRLLAFLVLAIFFSGVSLSNSPLRSSSSSLAINDLRLSSSESIVAAAAAALVECTPAGLVKRPLANECPDVADVFDDFIEDLLFPLFVNDDESLLFGVTLELDVGVLVVDVNTLEKLAKPFIKLGLLRKGDVRPKFIGYKEGIGKFGFEYKNGNDAEGKPDEPSMLAAVEFKGFLLPLLLLPEVDEFLPDDFALSSVTPVFKLVEAEDAKLFAKDAKSTLPSGPSFLLADWLRLARLEKFEKLNNGLFMPNRLANEDNDGVVDVVVDAGVVQVTVLLVLVVFVEEVAFETAAAAAAAASKNIFIDGSPESMLLLKPKLAKFAKLGLDLPVAFKALT